MKICKWLMISLFIMSFTVILALSESYSVIYNKGDKLNVFATSLNMRSEPSINAKIITNIPYGTSIKVLEKTTSKYESDGIKGNWVKVEYSKRTGYIFDGYLSKLPAPPENCKSFTHYAEIKLGKVGKEHKKIIKGKMSETKPDDNVYPYHAKIWQEYKYNAKIEIEVMYDPASIEASVYNFILKDISMEEAFLIVKLCGSQGMMGPGSKPINLFKDKAFNINSNGEISMDAENQSVIIKKDSKEYVVINFVRSL